jgi:hypothetical protein
MSKRQAAINNITIIAAVILFLTVLIAAYLDGAGW